MDRALFELDLDDDFEIVSNLQEISRLGVTKPPALMVNGKVKLQGGIPTVEEVVEILKNVK